MTKASLFFATTVLLAAGTLTLISCGGGGSNNQQSSSGIKSRAFVSNSLYPSLGGNLPVLNIVDASVDLASGFTVGLTGTMTHPGAMLLSPDHTKTMVLSPIDHVVAIVTNSAESVAGTITLPDVATSMAIDQDNVTAFVAVRNAPVAGQSPGAVEMLNIGGGGISATIPVPNARYVFEDPVGVRILAFADGDNQATVIAKGNIGTVTDPRSYICCFDNPVGALFADEGNTAYILECGPECGGSSAAVSKVDMTTGTIVTRVLVPAATAAQIKGTTLWVAGTPPGTACGSGTAAANCGTLTPVDLTGLTAGTPQLITNGYHDRMELTTDGQLFIGAINCTEINLAASGSSAGEVRGCLSIYDIASSTVVIPPQSGDVTGIAPILGRNIVYVVQGGQLGIYDTTKDKLQATQITLVGQLSDVKQAF